MLDFPVQYIEAIRGNISGENGDISIEIKIAPFTLMVYDSEEKVDTSIRLDCIDLPRETKYLEGKSFNFPTNPDEGYIDGSIYMMSVHNPVDVTMIEFGKVENKSIPIKMETFWLMEFEGNTYKNFKLEINTQLEL